MVYPAILSVYYPYIPYAFSVYSILLSIYYPYYPYIPYAFLYFPFSHSYNENIGKAYRCALQSNPFYVVTIRRFLRPSLRLPFNILFSTSTSSISCFSCSYSTSILKFHLLMSMEQKSPRFKLTRCSFVWCEATSNYPQPSWIVLASQSPSRVKRQRMASRRDRSNP